MRCDNIAQCKDHSDETNCEYVQIPNGYNKGLAPLDRCGKNLVHMSAKIISIQNIDPMAGKFTSSFRWHMRWYDSRVNFLNLNTKSSLNQISSNILDKIWLPGTVDYFGQ